MNKTETIKITFVLYAAYPKHYSGITKAVAESMVELWQACFAEDSYNCVGNALRAFILSDTKGFPPVPGQIKELMERVSGDTKIMSDMEAWATVRKAIRNSNYHAREEFDLLPELVKSVIVTPKNLIEWAKLNSHEVSTVIQSNFTRSYRAAVERQKELSKIPENIKKLMLDEIKQVKEQKECIAGNNLEKAGIIRNEKNAAESD